MRVCDVCGAVAVDQLRTKEESWDVCQSHKQVISDILNRKQALGKEGDDERGTPATA